MNIDLSADEIAKVERLATKWRNSAEEVLHKLVTNELRAYDTRKPWWRNFYLFGASWGKPAKSKFVADLQQRFDNISNGAEEAFKYIDVVTDRIISKAVGLLQFNAILSVLLVWAFEHYADDFWEHWAIVGSLIFFGV
jgi:hypothetical protein